jgi:riboflavin synthase
MFTGIVEERGRVAALTPEPGSARLSVHAVTVLDGVQRGASIAVNGVCLTVVEHDTDGFTVDVMPETLRRSSLGHLSAGSAVNLERAAPVSGRLGGHVVQGHVDGVGTVRSREGGPRWDVVTIDLPGELARYVVVKGSIAVDGVSLTVTDVDDREGTFSVSLIPTTLELTTLGTAGAGTAVNLEVDVLAKYVERLLDAKATKAQL